MKSSRGVRVAQLSVRLLVLAQVTILQFVGSSPASGFVLTVLSLIGILSLCLSLPFPPCSLFLKINKLKK